MKKKSCLVCLISLALLASAPLNASAEVLDDSFYSEEQLTENIGIADLEENTDDFISEDANDTDTFSSQIDEYSAEGNDTLDDNWIISEKDSRLSYKYDSETKTLSIKASEPVALPDNSQSGREGEWYNENVANAETIIIGDNITKIGAKNFDNHLGNYPNIKSVVLSPSVKEIGLAAFDRVSTLQDINLESVEDIGQNALEYTNIEKVILSQNTVSIGGSAFEACESLKEVVVKGNVSIGESAFNGCVQLNSFQCESSVSTVGGHAFYNCSALSLFKATSTTEVENYAFAGCGNLSEFDFSGTESIGKSAFARSGIKKANFNAINKIGRKAFADCSDLVSICYFGSESTWKTISKNTNYPTEALIHYKEDTVEAKNPTCTESGWKETGICDVCGQH